MKVPHEKIGAAVALHDGGEFDRAAELIREMLSGVLPELSAVWHRAEYGGWFSYTADRSLPVGVGVWFKFLEFDQGAGRRWSSTFFGDLQEGEFDTFRDALTWLYATAAIHIERSSAQAA